MVAAKPALTICVHLALVASILAPDAPTTLCLLTPLTLQRDVHALTDTTDLDLNVSNAHLDAPNAQLEPLVLLAL